MTRTMTRRPKWVWVISAWYAVAVVWGFLSFVLLHAGAIPLNAAQHEYFNSFGVVDYVVIVVALVILGFAVVQFSRLRKSAVVAFGVTIGLNLVTWLVRLSRGGVAQALGGTGLVSTSLGWVLLICAFLYARRLRERGVLT
jgi:hypothetical protein